MPRSMIPTRSGPAALAALGLALILGGCTPESSVTVADGAADAAFNPIGLSQAQSDMAQSGVRVEVRIRPGSSPLVATELAIGPANLAGEPEQIQANITAASSSAVTLDVGGFQVGVDANTIYSRDGSDATITADEFQAAVSAALAAGRRPHVVARRSPAEQPQAPDNAAFVASHVRLGGASDVIKIDLNAGPANLQLNSSPPPDAFLRLLALTIEIRISDGTTRIGRRVEQPGQRIEFAGRVSAVHVERGAFLLGSGLAVRVNDQTVIVENDGIKTLADVAAALSAGAVVEAEGAGSIESRDPKVVLALKVVFRKHRPMFEFRDLVKAADVDARTITLANGATLCVNDQSLISQDGDLKSLEQVARALAAHLRVAAAGVATPNANATTSNAADCRATVLKVRFTLVPPPIFEFRDGVKAVDVDARTITLASGITLCFNDQSVISEDGDLKSLEEVARALAANLHVAAAGAATPNAIASTSNVERCRATVLKVRFALVPPPILEFRDLVKTVDVERRKITLAVGAVLCLDDHSVISEDGDLKTLGEVARALEAGLRVGAAGSAAPGPYERDCRATVLRVRFSLANDG